MKPDPPPPTAAGGTLTSNPAALAAAALLVCLHVGLAVHSLWIKSPAFDEVSHLPAGLAAVATGEPTLNTQHPPLVKWLAGLAATTADPALPIDGEAYRRGDEWNFGRQVLFASGNDPWVLLRRGRLPVVALSALGALAVYAWSRRRFGTGGGLLSLALYSFSPTVLAHSRWVTFDAPLAALGTAALYLAWRARRTNAAEGEGWGRHTTRELVVGAVLGLVLAAKFSGLLIVAAAVVCDLLPELFRGSRIGWRRLATAWALRGAMVLAVLQIVYLSPTGPLEWIEGARQVYADVDPEYSFYLHGRFSPDGFPHYFLVAMAIKSALPGMIAALIGLGWALVRGIAAARRPSGADSWADDLWLWLPPLTFIAATSVLALDLGIRYVLPAYPPLLVLAGAVVPASRRWSRRLGPAAAAVLAIAQMGTALSAHPDYLPWFNRLAGGPEAGPRWLDDSNLDWGQDLGRLPAWLEERGIPRIALFYFGTGDPAYYGVPAAPLPELDWTASPRPGFYVISAHHLVHGLRRARTEGVATDWLDRYRPEDILGGTLYLYVIRPGDGPISSATREEPTLMDDRVRAVTDEPLLSAGGEGRAVAARALGDVHRRVGRAQ